MSYEDLDRAFLRRIWHRDVISVMVEKGGKSDRLSWVSLEDHSANPMTEHLCLLGFKGRRHEPYAPEDCA
jgi:hypothetical protein